MPGPSIELLLGHFLSVEEFACLLFLRTANLVGFPLLVSYCQPAQWIALLCGCRLASLLFGLDAAGQASQLAVPFAPCDGPPVRVAADEVDLKWMEKSLVRVSLCS